ncbi:Acg family FMN-binding oxidoreductase [Planosporangium sp. 12N6]|uniref:Acg family FMN-binding oxidoreductase n=1 Tax=Planosporangium spinosum TaxID=3402278 RepID=UPI003CEC8014
MATIELTDRNPATRVGPATRALTRAAMAAQRAPSIFNTQPWRWRIHDELAELRADRERQLAAVDSEGRMLTVSCGAALHHARVALAGAGHVPVVSHRPDPDDPDLLAVVRIAGDVSGPPAAVRLLQAIALRHTDRRPFADRPVPDAALDRLRAAAEEYGAHLHLVPPDSVALLAVAAGHAAEVEFADPAYRAELDAWTRGAAVSTGTGVPVDTAGPVGPRQVPVRDFAPDAVGRPAVSGLADRYARYAILFADADTPAAWLAAGEALSAVLLTATIDRLAASPMSDVVEVPATRQLLCDLIGRTGQPILGLRLGIPAGATPAAGTPRHAGADLAATTDLES